MHERVELELDLAVDGQAGYHVTARSAAIGEHSGRLLLDPAAVLQRRGHLQTTLLASAVTTRGPVGEFEAPVREVGEALFHALFDDDVYAAYKASLALAAERGTQLRVVLRAQPAELAALPWEMMYDPEAGAYLCQREPLVRHIAASSFVHPLEVEPPLRVLGVVSAPRDRQQLDVEGEKQRLRDALSPLGARVSLKWVRGGQWADVQRELIAESWHVLHFVGHGGFNEHAHEGALVLENDHGGSDLVGAERFSDLLSLQVTPLRLVLLNSCAGGQSAADDPFSSSAATLIRSGVSAVVAMQFAVSDPAAMAFSAGFYQAIAHNRTVAEAVRIGRIGIRGIGEHTLEWVTPVVYLRGDDTTLFDVLPPPPGEQAQELSPVQAAREAAALALYQKAMEQLEAQDYAGAVADFDALLEDRDDYRDATDRRAEARRGAQLAALQERVRTHVAAEDWEAALSAADELQRLAPDHGDPDGLAATARAGLRRREEEEERDRQRREDEQERQRREDERDRQRREEEEERDRRRRADDEERDRQRREEEDERRRREEEREQEEQRRRREEERRKRLFALLKYVGAPAAAIVLAGGVGLAWPDCDSGGDDVPAPFRSAALYDLARHHFEPGDCRVPSADEAKYAQTLPHDELLKCYRDEQGYRGALLCTASQSEFDVARQGFLDHGINQVDVTPAPAGRDEPWPFQVAYNYEREGLSRVLFHDESSFCLVELQEITDTEIQAAIDDYTTGLGS